MKLKKKKSFLLSHELKGFSLSSNKYSARLHEGLTTTKGFSRDLNLRFSFSMYYLKRNTTTLPSKVFRSNTLETLKDTKNNFLPSI